MSKVAVVYWSATGNTEAMAKAVGAAAESKGAEVTFFGPSEFSSSKLADFDAVAFGCPAMGAGANLVTNGVMANNAPDDEALENCADLGRALV